MKLIPLLTLSLLLYVQTTGQYKNLVMEGAGIRGIAYTGALKILEAQQALSGLERVGGTSVGAIVGLLLSVGYTADELKEIMFDLKVQTFNDGNGFFIGGQKRVRKNFGWYRGEALERWLTKLVEKKCGDGQLSFMALHQKHVKDNRYKDLFITATNLTKQKVETFSWISHPQMSVVTAVRISISIPIYFTAVFIDSSGQFVRKPKPSVNYQVYADGGILANYPIILFDTLHLPDGTPVSAGANETIGLKVERPEQLDWYKNSADIAPFQINTFRQYVSALYNVIIENLNRSQPFVEEKTRTIYINTGNMNPRVRKLSPEEKQLLYDMGKEAATTFMNPAD